MNNRALPFVSKIAFLALVSKPLGRARCVNTTHVIEALYYKPLGASFGYHAQTLKYRNHLLTEQIVENIQPGSSNIKYVHVEGNHYFL
jgi:hypothetical protein